MFSTVVHSAEPSQLEVIILSIIGVIIIGALCMILPEVFSEEFDILDGRSIYGDDEDGPSLL